MFAKVVKHSLVESDLKVADLARMINTSYANLSQKMKRDNFSEKEMQQIADALCLDLDIVLANNHEEEQAKRIKAYYDAFKRLKSD